MSEFINSKCGQCNIRRRLLVGASFAALSASLWGSNAVGAEEQGRPTVWIELGGQFETTSGGQSPFSPSFVADFPSNFFSPRQLEDAGRSSVRAEGKIIFEPAGSDWVLSASLRFGRSNGARQKHQQTPNAKVPFRVAYNGSPVKYGTYYPSRHVKFEDAATKQSGTHSILDFQAGKDVGVGLFGTNGSSVLSAGVRIAQFTSKTSDSVRAEPDVQYPTAPIMGTFAAAFAALNAFKSAKIHFHDYASTAQSDRSFTGVGPSVNWNASMPVAGNSDGGEVTLDWGATAAVLFGRQKVQGHHQTVVQSYYLNTWRRGGSGGSATEIAVKPGYFYNETAQIENQPVPGQTIAGLGNGPVAHRTNRANINRTRTTTVPDLGGFAGVSFRYAQAKVSFGYRADFFFGAMDEGFDTRKPTDVGFHGPFATISVGL